MINDIGNKIKYLMLIKGVSVQDLGDCINKSKYTVYYKLRNDKFTVQELQQIADYLGADLLIDFVLVD